MIILSYIHQHILAGQPDHRALGMSFSPDWMQKTRHIPKQPPTGYARSTVPFDHGITFDEIAYLVDNLGQDEKLASDFANLLSSDVTKTTECDACGGKGHAASQIMPDGTKKKCATVELFPRPKRPTGSTSTKPKSYRKEYAKSAKKIASLEEQLKSLLSKGASEQSSAENSQVDSENESLFEANTEASEASDDSDSSDGSSAFANQLSRTVKRKGWKHSSKRK